jgi:Cu-Zn family superoxide dismutase
MLAAIPAGLSVWQAAAQQAPRHRHVPSAATAPRPAESSAVAMLRKRFDELLANSDEEWPPSAKRKAEMFEEFLAWPRNPFEIQLVVSLTSASGVGRIIGVLAVKNSEIMVAGRKEAALYIKPELSGLRPGRYAFHVHENPDCGPAMKDGRPVPGLAAGSHLWLSGTGAMSGVTFGSHLGDLPNLEVDADGTARKPVVAARLTLADVVNRAFVVHASQDDNSDRLACAALN